ncbi:kynurenine--oxoglutarate transaminase 3 [Aplysia californica]|uniref:kynurenine--oxoglutarate transaminase n=1 Tax=Aplysia californica TaxID=6500 RepID=A0ABM1VPW1_APLCA|nr:kynurenine--oxoglutarate transaminase 3 [Aplysia californica]
MKGLSHLLLCVRSSTCARVASNLSQFEKVALGSVSAATSFQTRKMSSQKFQVTKRLQGTEKNVWVDISKMAVENKALNLGQGFPDFMAPADIVNCLKEVVSSSDLMTHQYARSFGLPRLVNALAKIYEPHLGRPVDPMTEVLVTVGAYGSLYCVIQGLVNPGDEVIIIEPFFDCYKPMVTGAGGVPVFVPLRPSKEGTVTSSGDWKLDPEELASKFNEKTKLIIVNTPNNPLGKVFTRDELTMIADLCKKHDVACVADEVYEWMLYDGNKHIKMASLPDMWERTVTIGSAGKTFSVTGWKTGWCVGPKHLVHCAMVVHQNCTYNCPTPIQEAVARGLELEMSRVGSPDSYLTSLSEELRPKRDFLAGQLEAAGMRPVVPEGGYFMLADYSNIKTDVPDGEEAKDFRFVKWLTVNKKLTVIPPSAFYCDEHRHMVENYIRFCFIKEDSTLEKASKILQGFKG